MNKFLECGKPECGSVPVGYKYLINGYKRGQVPVDDETVLYGVHDLYGIRGDVCLHMNVWYVWFEWKV